MQLMETQQLEPPVAAWLLGDLVEGQTFSYDRMICLEDVDAFAKLTGDVSPLHIDENFARSRGFKARVVHGVLLAGMVSRLIGVHLPGRNALLARLDLKFWTPIYAGDTIRVCGTISQISVAANAIIVQINIFNLSAESNNAASGSATIGITKKEKDEHD